jgi:hypothetical protein
MRGRSEAEDDRAAPGVGSLSDAEQDVGMLAWITVAALTGSANQQRQSGRN